MSQHHDAEGRPFTGRHLLLIMLAFFGVVVGVNLTMAVLASGSWPGLVVPNSYVASQEFNGKLDAAAAQADLGWHGEIAYQDGLVAFDLRDRDGQPVSLSEATLGLGRPSTTSQDITEVMRPDGSGRVVVDRALAPGQWIVQIEAVTMRGEIWHKRWRLYVPEDGS